jgi:hypothetical protein
VAPAGILRLVALKEYQAWGTPDGRSITFSTTDGIQDMMRQTSWEPDNVYLYSIWARSRLDAMQQHNRAQGWEEYKPMLDENGDPHPDDVEFED